MGLKFLYECDMNEQNAREVSLHYFQRAYYAQMRGALAEAIDLYKRSIEVYPTAEAHTFLGWAYSFQGKYEGAIRECLVAIEIDPDFGNPYNDIGAYLIELERFDQAIHWLEKAVKAKRYESRCFPYYNLGRVYEKKWEWRKAITYYDSALRENPEYTLAARARDLLNNLVENAPSS